jgi:hypothetical protein
MTSGTYTVKYVGSTSNLVLDTDYEVFEKDGFNHITFINDELNEDKNIEVSVNGLPKRGQVECDSYCTASEPFVMELVSYGCNDKGKFEKVITLEQVIAEPRLYLPSEGTTRAMYSIKVHANRSKNTIIYV